MAGTGKAPKAQIGDRVRFKDQNHINRRGQTGKVVGLIRLAARNRWDYIERRYIASNTLRYRVRCDEDGTVLQVQGYSFEIDNEDLIAADERRYVR